MSVTTSIKPSRLDVGFGDVISAMLASLWRRKLLIAPIVATALVLGAITTSVVAPTYVSEAYIRGGFVASNAVKKVEDDSTNTPYVGLDLARVIETQSRLLQSHDLARRVVQHVGLERLGPEVTEKHWLPDLFYKSAANGTDDEVDRAASRLLSRLSVSSDLLRTYLIKVSYGGKDPAFAVNIANAFSAEFLRSSNLQVLSQQRSSAEAALTKELQRFGSKHPKVMQAQQRLATLHELIKAQLRESSEALFQAAGENLTKATPSTTAQKPNPVLVLALFLILGVMVAIVAALRLERPHWSPIFSSYIRPLA